MGEPIRIRARSKAEVTEVMVLMPHPMETGLGVDTSGAARVAHYITDVQVRLGERVLLKARMSIAVARDPLISFRFKGGHPGDDISVTWTDNLGERRTDTAQIV